MKNLSFCCMDKTWIDLSGKADYPKVAKCRKGTRHEAPLTEYQINLNTKIIFPQLHIGIGKCSYILLKAETPSIRMIVLHMAESSSSKVITRAANSLEQPIF